jgi:hypothetical protein
MASTPADPTAAIVEELRALVPRYFAVERAFARASGVDDGVAFEDVMKPGASAEQIVELEARLGRALPPSYRAFLSLWNGARFDFGAGAAVLGTGDHHDAHIQQRIRDKRALFAELAAADPFDAAPIPFVVGDSRTMILFESPVRADGDMDVVTYYLTNAEHRDRGLVAFFERSIAELEAAMPRPKRKARPRARPKPAKRKPSR